MQTELEKIGLEARREHLVRKKYNKNNEYSASHPDALSDGDPLGKGTGHGGHSHSIPHATTSKAIDYGQIDTSGGGGLYDIEGRNGVGGRKWAMSVNLYSENNEYWRGANAIDTSASRADGQIFI